MPSQPEGVVHNHLAGHFLPGGAPPSQVRDAPLVRLEQNRLPLALGELAALPEVGADVLVPVTELLSSFCHVVDNGVWDRLASVFAPEGSYEVGDDVATGIQAITEHLRNRGTLPSHHTVNTLVRAEDVAETRIRAWSRLISIAGDGSVASADVFDSIRRGPEGWRVARRVVQPRHGGAVPADAEASRWLA